MTPLEKELSWEPKVEVREGFAISCAAGFAVFIIATSVVIFGLAVHQRLLHNALCYGPAPLMQLAWSLLVQSTRPHFAQGIRAGFLVTVVVSLGMIAVYH